MFYGSHARLGRRPTRTCLRHAVRLQRARSFENDLVNVANSLDGIIRRFVVMLRVVASRDGVGKIQLVTVEVPILRMKRSVSCL